MYNMLTGLDVLVRCVQAGSLAEAARRSDVSKATLSQQLSALEKHLATRLVERSRSGIRLTDVGQAVYQHAQVMAQAAQAAARVARQGEQPAGRLRITTPSAIVDNLIVPVLAKFMRLYPLVQLHIVATDTVLDLQAQNMDLALRFGWVVDGDFVARPLLNLHDTICASPQYLAQRAPLRTPEDLSQHDWVVHTAFETQAPITLRHSDGRLCHFLPQARVASTATASILQWVQAGLGLAFVLDFEAAASLRSGALVRVLPEWQLPQPTLYMVYKRDPYMRGTIRHLVDFLIGEFGPAPASE